MTEDEVAEYCAQILGVEHAPVVLTQGDHYLINVYLNEQADVFYVLKEDPDLTFLTYIKENPALRRAFAYYTVEQRELYHWRKRRHEQLLPLLAQTPSPLGQLRWRKTQAGYMASADTAEGRLLLMALGDVTYLTPDGSIRLLMLDDYVHLHADSGVEPEELQPWVDRLGA